MTYKDFDKANKDHLKAQIASSFKLGVTAAAMSKTMLDEKKKHEENVKAMTATLVVFADYAPHRSLVRRIKERIESENQWIKHYTKCEEEYKKGLEKIRTALKNAAGDMKVTVEMIVKDNTPAKPAVPAKKEKPLETGTPMLARQFTQPEQPRVLSKEEKKALKKKFKKEGSGWRLFAVKG